MLKNRYLLWMLYKILGYLYFEVLCDVSINKIIENSCKTCCRTYDDNENMLVENVGMNMEQVRTVLRTVFGLLVRL